jgi:hypothetical protein
VRGCALLLTTVPRDVVRRGDYFEAHLAALNLLLGEESVELREAAGEAVAVLYDAYRVSAWGGHGGAPHRVLVAFFV